MADPKHPKPGDLNLNLSDITVVDLTPDEVKRLTKVRDGIELAADCVLRLSDEEITNLGLSTADIKRLGEASAEYRRIIAVLPAAEKLVELLDETRLQRGHQMNLLLGEMASQARRRAERDAQSTAQLGPLADLMAYQYGPAEKAAATRIKKKTSVK